MNSLETVGQIYEIKKPEMINCLNDLLLRICNCLEDKGNVRKYFFNRNGVIEVREKEVYMKDIIDTGLRGVVNNLIGAEIR